MLELEQQVIIDSTSISEYVISIERRHCICETTAGGTVRVSPDCVDTLEPYADIVIYELGTKVFTGYTASIEREKNSGDILVNFVDPSIKLIDYWLQELIYTNNETAQYWIGYMCDLAGVDYTFDTTLPSNIPPEENTYTWAYTTTAMDVIKELLTINGYWMYSDPDGIIHFSQGHYAPITITLESGVNIISQRRERSTTPTRNRSIVFGRGYLTAESNIDVDAIDGTTKTAVVASPHIVTQRDAATLAERLALAFSRIKDEKYYEVVGDPNITVAQFANIVDTYFDLDTIGQITEVSSKMSADGYVMDIIIDQYCPKIWGPYSWTSSYTVYSSTDGQGIYAYNPGGYWTNITSGWAGDWLYVRGISAQEQTIWAATKGGIKYTTDAGNTWYDKTPDTGISYDWADIEIDPNYSNTVYAYGGTMSGVYMYKTTDNGNSWNYTEVA